MEQRVAVSCGGADGIDDELVIRSFTDQDKIAGRVASAVRRFVRNAPVTRSRSRMQLIVDVFWTEPDAKRDATDTVKRSPDVRLHLQPRRAKKRAKK
jgi:hypothetical protein